MGEPILLDKISKQPAEKFPFAIDFTGRLPSGLTISSATVTATVYQGGASASSVLEGSPVVANNVVTIKVKDGSDGVMYKITFTVALSDNFSVLEEDILMEVVNK